VSAMIGTRHTFVSYFAFAVDTIMKVLLREGIARGPQELVVRTGQRIRRLERRFNALLARWRAGMLPAVRREEVTPHPGPPPQGGREKKAWEFPRGRGWVVRLLVPVTGPQCLGMLCVAWEEPEMAQFYAAAPQLGRILRPLAHMIGAPLPMWLRLPKRVRVRKKDTSPRPTGSSPVGKPAAERRGSVGAARLAGGDDCAEPAAAAEGAGGRRDPPVGGEREADRPGEVQAGGVRVVCAPATGR
jgi:hypothetical protein